uniref:Integrase catalytic domain-containing protein n=2 Tax=Caenorhabditis japonica TaxID=281687 RepID=A0A8R1EHG4_CAEJA
MGLVCPITISTKMLMQLMWKEGVSLDSPISKKLLPEWKKIRKAFEDPCYHFPRQLTTRYNYEEVQMLVFCDANDHNFAACVYLRFSFKDSPPVTNLYLAKTRQKSLNQTSTTPRMELMAIEIGLNAAATFIQEKTVNVSQIKIFSDSQIALYWILKGDRCHAFLSNRVATINDVVASLSGYNVTFHHVPGSCNPADIASRGATLAELKKSSLWQHGPDFLKLSTDQWPNSLKKAKDYEEDELKAIMKELVMPTASTKKKLSKFQTVAINVLTAQTIDAAWKTEAYTPRVFPSRLCPELPHSRQVKNNHEYTATRSFGFIMKFLARAFPHQLWKTPLMKTLEQLENLPRTEEGSVRLSLQITARELVRNYILKDHYLDDFFSNSGDNPGNFRLRCHRSLAPIRASDGLFHIRRPIEQSHASTSEKFPIFVINDHPLAKLVARDLHIQNKHASEEQLIRILRKQYSISTDRRLCSHICRTCFHCRRQKARPYSSQFPTSRVCPTVPFQNIGIDYAGPIIYRGYPEVELKSYILVVTSLFSRAVHLELVPDESALSYLFAMRRVFARRGVPRLILSDNAGCFKLGGYILNGDIRREGPDSRSFSTYMAENEIRCQYITPLSPWQGGVYERLVGLTKKLLRTTLGMLQPTYVELETQLVFIEGVLSNRPITKNPALNTDRLALRPIDFLLPSVPLATPWVIDEKSFQQGTTTEKTTRKFAALLLESIGKLVDEWSSSYLTGMHKAELPLGKSQRRIPRVDDVVLVYHEKYARYTWPLGLITKLHPSEDGAIRSATVRFEGTELKRPVNHLIPLKVPEASNDPAQTGEEATELDRSSFKSRTPLPYEKLASVKAKPVPPLGTLPPTSTSVNESRKRSKIDSRDPKSASQEQFRARPYLSRLSKSTRIDAVTLQRVANTAPVVIHAARGRGPPPSVDKPLNSRFINGNFHGNSQEIALSIDFPHSPTVASANCKRDLATRCTHKGRVSIFSRQSRSLTLSHALALWRSAAVFGPFSTFPLAARHHFAHADDV